jgi:hypothetical protein
MWGFTGGGRMRFGGGGTDENIPQGLKPSLILLCLFGTAEAVLFQNHAEMKFFPQPV